MQQKIFNFFIFIFFSLTYLPFVSAANTCCLQHGGLCGDACCDTTALKNADCGTVVIVELPEKTAQTASKDSKSIDEHNSSNSPQQPPLYIWQMPSSQTAHAPRYFSERPPAWYRNNNYPDNYPRVLVFDGYQRLLDDTEHQADVETMQHLRNRALLLEQQRQKEEQRIIKVIETPTPPLAETTPPSAQANGAQEKASPTTSDSTNDRIKK